MTCEMFLSGRGSSPAGRSFSVQPHHKDSTLWGSRVAGQCFRALAIIALHLHAHPPVTCRTAEAERFGGVITVGKVLHEFVSRFLLIEAANLHGPMAAALERGRGLEHFHLYDGDAG